MPATFFWAKRNDRFPVMSVSHLTAAVLFALFASIVFGITMREGVREQVRYGLEAFAWFIGGTIAGGWLLYFLNPH